MCLLTFIPTGTQPDMARLRQGAENNPDGHGYAIATPEGRLIVGRGLDEDDVLERFEIDRRVHPNGPALFHSRIATAGKVNFANCHPFHLGNDSRTVIAHNGILPNDAQPYVGDVKRSDTRILAEILLPKGRVTHSLRTRKGRQRFANWLGRGNKVVILTVNPAYAKSAYIMNVSMGTWDEGIWYSNDSYNEPWWRKYDNRGHYEKCDDGVWRWVDDPTEVTVEWMPDDYDAWDRQAWRWDDDRGSIIGRRTPVVTSPFRSKSGMEWTGTGWREPDQCHYCYAKHALHPVTGMCEVCQTCNSCGNAAPGSERSDETAVCLCYIPEHVRGDVEAMHEIARATLQLTVGPEVGE